MRPVPDHRFTAGSPEGAFVHCFVGATDLHAARASLQRALESDGFEVIEYGEVLGIEEYQAKGGRITEDVTTMIDDVLCSGGVYYSSFFSYERT